MLLQHETLEARVYSNDLTAGFPRDVDFKV